MSFAAAIASPVVFCVLVAAVTVGANADCDYTNAVPLWPTKNRKICLTTTTSSNELPPRTKRIASLIARNKTRKGKLTIDHLLPVASTFGIGRF